MDKLYSQRQPLMFHNLIKIVKFTSNLRYVYLSETIILVDETAKIKEATLHIVKGRFIVLTKNYNVLYVK